MKSARTILLVEDESDLREAISLTLHRRGYEVLAAADAMEAEGFLGRGLPDLLLADMMLPGASGFHVVRLVNEQSEGRLPVLMMSANSSKPHRDYALAAGVNDFLAKPFPLAELIAAVEKFCPLLASEPAELARGRFLTRPVRYALTLIVWGVTLCTLAHRFFTLAD